MKKTAILLTFALGWAITAQAGVLNQPESIKDVVKNLNPKVGSFRDLQEPDWETLYSASLYDFTKNDYKLGSVDLGYCPKNKVLGLIYLNLEGLQAFNIELPLGKIQPQAGIGGGYDFENKRGVYGFALVGWQF